ncbi:MAG: hypothetical protein M1315_03535 [Candidatus Thermoplasmatota archaeon]|nr:hypothetical protein [Candidatus Thermoplasmatota archaeon]
MKRIAALTFLAFVMLVSPISFASSGTIDLNRTTNIAAVNENYTLSVNITGPGIALVSMGLFNVSGKETLNSSTSVYGNLSNSIASMDSAAAVSNLSLSYMGHMSVYGDTILYNMSMGFLYNLSGAYSSGAWNLTWRSASFHAFVRDYFKIGDAKEILTRAQLLIILSVLSPLGLVYVNMSGMSVPLSSWTKSFSSSLDRTTFSCSSSSFLYSRYSAYNNTITVYADPSYSIVTPGYAVPYGNDIVYEAKQTLPTSYIYAAAGAVIIVAIIAGMFIRRRTKS